jgi:hypothetical protein
MSSAWTISRLPVPHPPAGRAHPEEHAERDAYYTARRDRSQADRYDYNTVVRYGGQTAAETRAVRQEQTRTREIARAKRRTPP